MRRRLLLLLLLIGVWEAALAQSRRIAGKVLDETGLGLPGAGVTVKGTSAGTVADVDGNYQLDVPDGSTTLVVQSIGYRTQEVAIADNLTIRLAPSSQELEGTVVTALALRREKRSLGYGTTSISGDELNQANNFSPLSAIQGKTAGVNITSTTGGPGGSTRIVMRGEKSLRGNNQALIVVDGIPINNGNRLLGRDERSQVDFGNRANDIDPDDIENISVLKGAVAAALYGEQGANGAIIITTKSGKGRTKEKANNFTFTSSYTLSDILKYPEFQNKYGQGDVNGIADDRRENFSWGLPFDGQLRPWGQIIDGQQRIKRYEAQKNNVRSFFNKGQTWENNLQLGGSNETGNYLISLNTLNNKGIVPNTFFDKYTIRFNGSMEFANKFYSNASVNYINSSSRVESQGQGQGGLYNQLIQTPRDIPVWELKDLNNPFNAMGIRDANGVERYGYYGAYTANPYWVAKYVDNRIRTDRVISTATIGYRPNKHWDIFNRLGVDYTADRAQLKIPKYNYLPFEEDYYTSGGDPQIQTSNGGYTESSINTLFLNNDLIANYNYELNKDFTLSGLAGANLQINRVTSLIGDIDEQENGLVVPGYYNLQNAQGPVNVTNSISEYRRVSLYGQASLGFRNFLFLDATLRNDWSSTVRKENRVLLYPSLSFSYVFTEHLKNLPVSDVLNYGKLRGSYAAAGVNPDPYSNNLPGYLRAESATGFGTIRFPFQGRPGFSFQNSIGDPNLKPEVTKTWEVGTELNFFRDRFNLDFTYYQSQTNNPIVPAPVAPSSGFTTRNINSGEIRNTGVEIQARVTPIRTATGFSWELFGTFTRNRNRVESLAPGVTQLVLGGVSGASVYAQVGQPYGAFYTTDLLRDDQGRVVVDSGTGLPQLDPNQVYRGTYQPKFLASWGTNLRYKGLTFNVLFNTRQGGVFFSRTKDIMAFTGTSKETENRDERVFPNSVYQSSDGSYVVNTTQTFNPYQYYTNVIPSGQHIVDASYIKLSEASLTYTFDKRLLRRTFLGSAYLSIYGSNLFIWTPRENKYVDPEMNSGGASNLQGFDFSSRFSMRNYGIRLGLTF